MVYVFVVLVEKGQNPPNPLYEGGAGVIYQKLGSDAKNPDFKKPTRKSYSRTSLPPFVKGAGGI